MAHNIETMAYAGETPWHGLGVEVEDDLSADEMLVKAGLNWKVVKRPLAFRTKSGSTKAVPARYALVRETDENLLSLCGANYKPAQNSETFDFFKKFIDAGHMKMHTAGSLLGGQYVWALAQVGDSFTLPGKDKVEGYLLLMSPHVAGRALIIQHTAVRVVCWNTLNAALGTGLKGNESAFRMPHVYNFDDTMRARAEEALGLSQEHLREFKEKAEILVEKKVSTEWSTDYFKQVMKIGEYSPARAEVEATNDNIRQRTSPVLVKLQSALIDSPGAALPTAKGTAWGAFNAVTWVMDREVCTDPGRRLRDNWLGGRGTQKREALDLALKLAA